VLIAIGKPGGWHRRPRHRGGPARDDDTNDERITGKTW